MNLVFLRIQVELIQFLIVSNPVLHHKKYNWKALFAPQYVGFAHQICHDEVHSGKRGYKRSLSYFETKLLVMVNGIISILIITGIMYIFRGY